MTRILAAADTTSGSRLLFALVLFLLSLPTFVRAEGWFVLPYVRTAGGHESTLIVDPAGAAVVIPGGSFFDLSPALLIRRTGENGLYFGGGTRATFERFSNDVGRTLYGQVLWADLARDLSRKTRLRVSVSGNYFDDSEQSTLRRISGGAEVGIVYTVDRWIVEGFAGGHRVIYPNVDLIAPSGNASTYGETRWSSGAAGSLVISQSVSLRLSLQGQGTSAVDPDFDSTALLADLGLHWFVWRDLGIQANYARQDRSFTNRASNLDTDEYQQWGLGLNYSWKNDLSVSFRWSEGRYVDTADATAPIDRVELALSFGPSNFGVPTPVRSLDWSHQASSMDRQTADGVLFRVHAPEARLVEVTGEFNGWGRSKSLLEPTQDGWWELRIPLSPGGYQYVYLIDGKTVTPPESPVRIDDGFGGENGYVEVFR
ncbi:MAG TPA: glycogen-binding domain-containing protein [Rhodothermia bacterium]|nr:glycogen-binding domain-containing protein [Rhodothermia bacterium]